MPFILFNSLIVMFVNVILDENEAYFKYNWVIFLDKIIQLLFSENLDQKIERLLWNRGALSTR